MCADASQNPETELKERIFLWKVMVFGKKGNDRGSFYVGQCSHIFAPLRCFSSSHRSSRGITKRTCARRFYLHAFFNWLS